MPSVFYHYLNVFVVSFLASTILPFGSEPLVAGYTHKEILDVFTLLMVATFGNFFGSLANYYVGRLGHKTVFSKIVKIDEKKLKKAKILFDKYGNPVLFFSWVPVIGDAMTFFAGLVKSDLKAFAFFVFAGKLFRYAIIIGIFSL
ncbi:MAG: DedA family protein [Candidatus Nanohalarchaeota archaeon]|nr:MAG: DedA family protein [Candidatus Nanohaloarchaeota archaeon]